MTARKKIAQKRLTFLSLAEQLRNASEIRHHGFSASPSYAYKRTFRK
jgi:hypothetical protein